MVAAVSTKNKIVRAIYPSSAFALQSTIIIRYRWVAWKRGRYPPLSLVLFLFFSHTRYVPSVFLALFLSPSPVPGLVVTQIRSFHQAGSPSPPPHYVRAVRAFIFIPRRCLHPAILPSSTRVELCYVDITDDSRRHTGLYCTIFHHCYAINRRGHWLFNVQGVVVS